MRARPDRLLGLLQFGLNALPDHIGLIRLPQQCGHRLHHTRHVFQGLRLEFGHRHAHASQPSCQTRRRRGQNQIRAQSHNGLQIGVIQASYTRQGLH